MAAQLARSLLAVDCIAQDADLLPVTLGTAVQRRDRAPIDNPRIFSWAPSRGRYPCLVGGLLCDAVIVGLKGFQTRDLY